ncbi:MAG: pilus assembly protein PilM [Elusimicrobia bacterium]|nr:pilus assembly protein PilM [Elusimicrobiota bacterium]
MKKPAAVRSLLYSGDLLAVDLGTFAVKVLSMKAKERSLTVIGSASREVWRELSGAKTEEEKSEVYARVVRELMAEHAFKPRNASISLSGNTVILRFLTLPAGHEFSPDAGLPPEARALIPFDESEAIVSALPLDSAKGVKPPRPEMMLTMAQKKTVRDGMDVARKAGLRPAVIVNDALALVNAYQFFEGKKADETVVLAGIGASATSVVVLEGGSPRAARVVNIAGAAFTRAVKREFDVDLEEAERLKLAHGLSVPGNRSPEEEAAAARVARALKPAVKDLTAEIQRTLDVFLERRPAGYPPVRRLVLAGGSAELAGLAGRLAADTGLEVDVFRPIVNTAAKDGSLGVIKLPAALAGPCGLALSNTLLRRWGQSRINLVPRKARRSAIIRDVSPGFWRLIAGPAIAAAALSVYAVRAVNTVNQETAMEQSLEAATRKQAEAELRFEAKKKPAAPVKRVENPFAYLARLTISGVFGDARNTHVMLNGDGTVFVARGGRLYNGDEEEVAGVRSEIRDNSLALTANGRVYLIDLPK